MGMHGLSRVAYFGGGDVETFDMKGYSFPSTVWVNPGSGYSILVEYSCDGGIEYDQWSAGTVTSRTQSVFDAPVTHLRFTLAQSVSPTTNNPSSVGVC